MVDGQRVVLGERAGLGATLRDDLHQLLGGGLGHVLIERTRGGAGPQDPADGLVVIGAKAGGVIEGGYQISALIVLA